MTIKKMRLLNLRIDDQQLDEIERIAIERFDGNTSEAIRFLAKLGMKFDAIKPLEITKEKIDEITNEMKQMIKDEEFCSALDSLTSEQQGAIKRYLMIKEEEREKRQP